MLKYLLEAFTGVEIEYETALVIQLQKAFERKDPKAMFRTLQGVFRSAPY